jgi:hypothetical protein
VLLYILCFSQNMLYYSVFKEAVILPTSANACRHTIRSLSGR